MKSRAVLVAAVLWQATWAAPTRAADDAAPAPSPDPPARSPEPQKANPAKEEVDREEAERRRITGIEEPAREEGDAGKDVANVFLWLPRNITDLLFRGMQATAGLVADNQLVPRVRDLLGTEGGDIIVFPTLFAETGSTFSVGLRMITETENVSSSNRIGFGGPNDVAAESRLLFTGGERLPFAINLEGFYELQSELEYHGVGITPERDPRNRFRTNNPFTVAKYQERRVRGILGMGLRLSEEFEFFLSSSLYRRQITDSEDTGAEALSQVFEPDSVPGAFDNTWMGYAEIAARLDTRDTPGRPAKGFLLESYLGGAKETEGEEVAFMRYGLRLAGFIPIYRDSNLLAPRFVADQLTPLNGLDVPFTELTRQPDYRGFDTRRDNLSMVFSLDYTWRLTPFMGLRLFGDGATVAPSVRELDIETFKELRYAVGLGVDFFTKSSTISQLAIATGPEGIRLLFSFGVPSVYGDRQHRK